MKKTIYIIIQDCSDDYDRSVEVKPYGSIDEARAEFKTLTDDRRVDATKLGWKIDEDTPNCFSAYEDGCECINHCHIIFQSSEINI